MKRNNSRVMFKSTRKANATGGGKLRLYAAKKPAGKVMPCPGDERDSGGREVPPFSAALCDEYKAWEYELQSRPISEVRPLSVNTLDVLKQASETGDVFAESLYAKSCEIMFAVKRARTTVLDDSVSQVFQRAAAALFWKDAGDTLVFDASRRSWVGTRLQALIAYGLADPDISCCLRATITNESNAHFLTSLLARESLPPFLIDMTLVKGATSGASFGSASSSTSTAYREDVSGAIHRATLSPLQATGYEDMERQAALLCPLGLSLIIGTMLTPLCSRLRAWKTLIVVSGSSTPGKPHLIDKVCADLVDLGVTTDFQSAVTCTQSARSRPFVLKLEGSAWKSGDSEFLDQIHAILKIGIIVIVKAEKGVPRDVCLQSRLRLSTIHLRDVTVDERLWQCHSSALFQYALMAYSNWDVKIPRVPFRDPIEGHGFRPSPRRSPEMSSICCYLSEMLHMEFGIRLQPNASVDIFQIAEALAAYSRVRLIFNAPEGIILPEDVLQAASDTREDKDRAVTYCNISKIFRHMQLCPLL